MADSTIVVVAGSIDEEEVIAKVERAFGGIATGPKGSKLPVVEKQLEPALTIRDKKTEQTQILMGVRTFSTSDDRKYTLEVLADIMGGSMSSHLWQKIRNQMGAAYSVWAVTHEVSDCGYLVVRAGLQHAQVKSVIEVVAQEMRHFKQKEVGVGELNDAKEHIVGQLMLGLETSDDLAWYYGLQEMLTRKPLKPDEVARRIKAVTAKDIKSLANDIFVNSGLNLALVGPGLKKSELRAILKID